MKTYKFKTNINCSGCVAGVTPFLNKLEGINWKVDIDNPEKTLTVEGEEISEEEILKAVKKAGFEIESQNS
ncbi:MAG: heavy-metal-associated domain-containing protein [Flavobacteriaceae bacterium]|jgi:copper chaperone|nr:heavy-metal-associated domain-containing protein [Flavobacteriaceae bacterium]